MKKLLTLAALVFTAVVASTSAHAAFITGNKLLDLYDGDAAERVMAKGYILGAVDAYDGEMFCVPENVSGKQVFDLSIAFIRGATTVRHHTADVLVAAALVDLWPCAKKPTSGSGVRKL